IAGRHLLARLDRSDHLANAIDDCEHRADERAIGLPPPGANVRKSVLRRVTKGLEPRKIEEAAIAFDGMDEAENVIETSAVVGLRLPGDDFPAQGFEHVPAFGYKIRDQVVHRRVQSPA